MNNLRIIALKFSNFANYCINVYFLLITAIKVSKFANSGQKHKIPTTLPKILTNKMVGILCFGLNLQTLLH